MDKKRAAMRQIKAIEAHGDRLLAIEQALTAPAVAAEPLELATAAQVEALAERMAAIALAVTPASDIVNAFSQVMNELGAIRQALAERSATQPAKK